MDICFGKSTCDTKINFWGILSKLNSTIYIVILKSIRKHLKISIFAPDVDFDNANLAYNT